MSQEPYRSLHITPKTLGPLEHLQLLGLLGRIGEVLLKGNLCSIDCRLHPAETNPDLLVEASRVITLIDGDIIADLVAKYELYVKPVTTYVLDEFYDSE